MTYIHTYIINMHIQTLFKHVDFTIKKSISMKGVTLKKFV